MLAVPIDFNNERSFSKNLLHQHNSVIDKSDLMSHFDDISKKNIEDQTFWIRHLLKAYFIAVRKISYLGLQTKQTPSGQNKTLLGVSNAHWQMHHCGYVNTLSCGISFQI